ncbi:MAG TPA: response regulator transcription factor [Tissierellia bacterium]|nr:response regulator transcription factor [Tissierellia bacterium]
MKRILFVEDDQTIASALTFSLEDEGYEVVHKATVQQALPELKNSFDLVLLDLGLPDGSGYEICRAMSGSDTPIVILSAVDDEANIVMGLELGAVDYVTKPFRLRELLTRIRGILRRREKTDDSSLYQLGNIRLDSNRARVTVDHKDVYLSALEYRLLLLLMQHMNQVLSREQIFEHLWDIDGQFISDNTLSVYIKRIREKIGDSEGRYIRTVRGLGYMAGE